MNTQGTESQGWERKRWYIQVSSPKGGMGYRNRHFTVKALQNR